MADLDHAAVTVRSSAHTIYAELTSGHRSSGHTSVLRALGVHQPPRCQRPPCDLGRAVVKEEAHWHLLGCGRVLTTRCSGRSPAEPYPPAEARRFDQTGYIEAWNGVARMGRVRSGFPFPFPDVCRGVSVNGSAATPDDVDVQ